LIMLSHFGPYLIYQGSLIKPGSWKTLKLPLELEVTPPVFSIYNIKEIYL